MDQNVILLIFDDGHFENGRQWEDHPYIFNVNISFRVQDIPRVLKIPSSLRSGGGVHGGPM